jgi:UDP:flavonoid glycosyltransferase YjiC (YdhE family)
MRQLDARRSRFDFAEDRPERLTWEYVSKGYGDAVPWWFRLVNDPMLDDLVRFCRAWRPDLVLWEPVTYSGAVAATVSGAVHARVMWSVDLFTRMRRHFLRLRPAADPADPLADWLDGRARRYGVGFEETMTTGHFTVDTVPDRLRLDPAFDLDLGLDYLPMRYVPYNGTAVVEPWLREPPHRPRVCLTLGVHSTEHRGGYAVPPRELLDALGNLDVEVVATLPAESTVEGLPDNVRVVSFAPLDALLPTCSAVIHHGSNGTFLTTVVHGVPQLVVPFYFQGGPLARYAQASGAGLTIPAGEVTGVAVRAAVLRLLDEPSFVAGSARLRAENAALPSPHDLVATIGQRVEKYRT